MNYTPRLDFVVLQMDAPEKKTSDGILLPKSVREDRVLGTVISIGPGRVSEHGHLITVEDLVVGDRVIFNKFSAYELDEDDRLYLLRGGEIGCKTND